MDNFNYFLESVNYLNHPYLSGLSGLIVLLIGILVLLKNNKSDLYRAFFLLNLAVCVWFLGNAFVMSNFNDIDAAIFWFRFAYTGGLVISTTYYHFYISFLKKRKNVLFILYIICLVEIIYLWLNKSIGIYTYILPNVGIVWGKMPAIFTPFMLFGMLKYAIIAVAVAMSFLKKHKEEKDPSKKNQLKWLSIIFFILIFGTSEWLPIFNVRLHIAWSIIPFFIASIAYSILRYQLLDIKIIIKKAFFYSVGIAIASGFIIGISFLSSFIEEKISGFRLWTVPVIAGSMAFIVGRIFWRKSKEVDKLKYEFITIAAHKLRTPLTEIKWAASALRDKVTTEAERNELVKEITNADNKLIDLTNELLAVSKAESGQSRYNLEPLNLEKIARAVVNSFQFQMKEKGIKLRYNFEKNLPNVNMDKARISSVIQVLMENAISYTKDEIKISIDVYKENVIFHIEDNGIGIKKEDQPYIFSKFYRSHEAYLTETEGTGIGLFLAKSIVDKHNGRIGVRSEGEGEGSIFWFSLPIA